MSRTFRALRKKPAIPTFLVDKKSSRNERAKMFKVGYARVSSVDQNLDRQIAALRAESCDKIYREKASGKSIKGRPELAKAIDALPTKGVLVVAEWDRATRSMFDGINLIEQINARGALLKVLDKPYLDLS